MGAKLCTSHHRLPGREEGMENWKCSVNFLEGTRQGHCQSDEQGNCFNSNFGGKTYESGWSAYGLFQGHIYHLELK